MGRRSQIVVVIALLWAPHRARADIDQQHGDRLFEEAVALRKTDPEAACAKFEEALRFNPQAPGILLNVAICDEQHGKIASAVARLQDLADRSREAGLDDYGRDAEARLATLRPQLPYVAIRLASPVATETKVLVDDRLVPADNLARYPVDPGDRVIVVTAPGRVAFRTTVTAVKQQTLVIDVPVLKKRLSRKTIGVITMAGGGAVFLGGVAIGLTARSRYNPLFEPPHTCDPVTRICDDPRDHAKAKSALTLGTVGTVAGVVGLGAVGVGLYIYLRAPNAAAHGGEPTPKVSLVPHVDRDGAGVMAVGRF
ncbi:MAG TPA: hypothetical protein VFQ53_38695 [Kofleriaceae bacterium]|nr:hypothetical protein [Kofleriaceae bacterium]